MRISPIAALLAISLVAGIAPDIANAKVKKQDFCAATQYCRIPSRFQRGPFLAKPLLREVSLREIQKRCTGHSVVPFGVANPVVGCARLQSESCVVYLPKEVRAISEEMFAMVVEHELAHCRGWIHGR